MSTLLLFALMIATWWPTAKQTWKKSYLFSDTDSVFAGSFFYHVSLSNSFSFLLCGRKNYSSLHVECVSGWHKMTIKWASWATLMYSYGIYLCQTVINKFHLLYDWIYIIMLHDNLNIHSWVLTLSRGFLSFFISMFICLSKVKCK